METNKELRKLMRVYVNRQNETRNKEMKEALESNDAEWIARSEGALGQISFAIKGLFNIMKNLDLLDEEELQSGTVNLDKKPE